MSAAQPFNPRLVFGLVAAGILAFAALLLLIAFGGGISGRGDGRSHALSGSAVGFRALVTLVGDFHQTSLVRSQGDLAGEDLLVVTLEPTSSRAAFDRLLERRQGRATLIVLPKWLTQPDPSHRGWVRQLGPVAGSDSGTFVGGVVSAPRPQPAAAQPPETPVAPRPIAAGQDVLNGLGVPIPESPQTITGKALRPLVALPGGGALVARMGDQPHYVVADPDLLDNHGLRDAATARAALTLIEDLNATGSNRVDFDLTMNGYGAGAAASGPNMLRTVLEPPFLAMTLALVAAALLAGLHGAFRFGPVRREARAIAFGKAALVENSAGLIRLAGREAHLGGAYAELLRQDAARAASAPSWLQGEKLDAYLDRLTRPGSPTFSTLALRLDHAHDRAGLVEAARALFQWKKDAIR